MSTVVAVANAAGSAGKSTTVVTLAALLGEKGRRVLVVDGDAQATATSWLGVSEPDRTVGDVLHRECSLAEATVATQTNGVSLVPADRRLDAQMVALATAPGKEVRLQRALAEVDADVVLIDCPGAIGTMTVSAMTASSSVLTVTQPTLKEINGIPELIEVVDEVIEYFRPALRLAGIVPCIVPPASGGRLYTEAQDLLHETWPDLVTPPVRRTIRVPESFAAHEPLPAYAARDQVTADYRVVLDWLTERGVVG